MFGLEKEQGRALRNTAITFVLVFSAVISFVYYVNAEIAPGIPVDLLKPATSTPDIFATPLTSPTPLGPPGRPQATATIPLVPTVTLSGDNGPVVVEEVIEGTVFLTTRPAPATAVPIIITPIIACNPLLNFSEPRDGGLVSGLINFIGTADTEDFQHYILEANGPETNGQWASLLGREVDQAINNSSLGRANLQNWASGPYLIRLTAVDINGNQSNICVIQVTLN
jgi:hypothetical protein